VYAFTKAMKINILLYFDMTLDVAPTNPISCELLVDGKTTGTLQLLEKPTTGGESGVLPDGWLTAAQDSVMGQEARD